LAFRGWNRPNDRQQIQKAEAVNNQRRGLKSALTFCFRPEHELKPNPSRSRAAFPARPDILHGARGKYDPPKVSDKNTEEETNQSRDRQEHFGPRNPFGIGSLFILQVGVLRAIACQRLIAAHSQAGLRFRCDKLEH